MEGQNGLAFEYVSSRTAYKKEYRSFKIGGKRYSNNNND